MTIAHGFTPGRRGFLGAAGSLAAFSLLLGSKTAQATAAGASTAARATGRRKLGKLEVSSVGLGVQNMSRTYQTTIPYRPEMLNIIRAAFDQGVTFFDAAEAYGPHEVERILGEGVAPFREQGGHHLEVRFDIDVETGALPRRAEQPARSHQAGGRGHAEAPPHRSHRPALPAPRRPAGADRRRRGRHQGPDGAGQGAALGPLRDGPQHAAPRARGAARQRRAERVLDAVAWAREGGPAHLRGARHRLRAVEPARRRVPDRRHRRADALRRR